MWKLLIVAAIVVAGAAALAPWSYQQARREAELAADGVAARAKPSLGAFEPSMVEGLPEIARRYFGHAMTARQILSPAHEFVWTPIMHSGAMSISGSDTLVQGGGWTRFWINGLIPVVNLQVSPDLSRSARARAAMEAVWAPASVLAANGVTWAQTGPDTARLTFGTGTEPVDLTLAADGRVLEVVTMRWSDVNADKTFRLQPFGGTVEAEQTFGGFTIPSELEVGNHYGSPDYLPFFQARVTAADLL